MTPPFTLRLGFYGDQIVHKDNARAALNDLVIAHRKTQKGSQVEYVIPIEPFTETMVDLADHALLSKFSLILVGHHDSFQDSNVQAFVDHAVCIELEDDEPIWEGVANQLLGRLASRLIMLSKTVAGPGGEWFEDDNADLIFHRALGANIKMRSMLHGLDDLGLPTLGPDEKPEEKPVVRVVDDLEDGVEDEEGVEDEDYEPDYEPDEEDLDEDEESEESEEEGEDEPPEEEEEEETEEEEGDEEEEPDPDEEEEEEAEEEPEPEEEEEPEAEEQDDVEEDPDDEEEGEEEPEEEEQVPVKAKASTGATRWTESKLLALNERDRDQFLRVAKKHKVLPGRGMKVSVMINRILERQNGKAPVKKTAAAPAKKTVAKKKAAPARKAVAKKAPVKAAANRTKKTVSSARRTKTTTQAKRPAATSGVPRVAPDARKKFIQVARAALELAEQLS